MAIPIKYRTTAPAVATFSYTEIAEGTGIQIFYGAHTKQTTNNTYVLSGTVIASNDIQTIGATDVDFDTSPFNSSRTIKGTAYISVPVYVTCSAGDSTSVYIIAKLRHVTAAAAESEIASAQSETLLITPVATKPKKFLVKITVPQTHFTKGETLRLTIELTKTQAGGGSGVIGLGHDPKERTSTEFPGTGEFAVTTSLEAHIPFKLDV